MQEFIYSAVCLTKDPQAIPERVLQKVQSSTSSFNFQYPLFSLSLFNSLLHLRPRLSVTSFIQ